MDGDLTGDRPSDDTPRTYSEAFESLCPVYLAMGMSYELFWDGDPHAVKAYREADRLRQERMNEQAWLNGFYFYTALADLAPALNGFSKSKPKDYMSKPIELKRQVKPKGEKQEQKAIENSRSVMEAFATRFNQQFAAKRKTKEGGDTDAND